jgi:hypothetical protein
MNGAGVHGALQLRCKRVLFFDQLGRSRRQLPSAVLG